ncbi:MAG: DUF3604 domain-containing protein [Pseudomonadales bacterium]
MGAELRESVELLKKDLRKTPTNQDNARLRALVVFDWINALALKGEYIPVNATTVITQINGYGVPSGPVLDQYIQELILLDEKPDALGRFEARPEGPFEVMSYESFEQTYTVGSEPVETGGGFLIAKHFNANHGIYQTSDSTAANYVSIKSNNANVEFVVDSFDVPGMHGGFRGAAAQLAFRVKTGELQPGDKVTITYGDTSGGGAGLRMPDLASNQMPFPVYVDLNGSNLWLSLPIQPIKIHGSKAAGVAGFAPSVLDVGEPFDLSIRTEDDYGNRATGEIPDWNLVANGKQLQSVKSNGRAVVLAEGIRFEEPGIYRIAIKAIDGTISGETNPILVSRNPSQRIYWGDTHGHSGFAEGIGTAEDFMRFARDEARLDFVTHSEHDIWMDDKEWQILRDLTKKYTESGEFIPYLGYEWTVQTSHGGHQNVLFRDPEDRERVPSQLYPTQSQLYNGLRNKYDVDDVLIIPHAHQRGEYRQSDPDMGNLIEIMSMHGTFEWFGRMYLSHGHQVGFVAGSDDHVGRPGYAKPKSNSLAQRGGLGAVFAKEKTIDGIFDSMKSLRAYATTGERIILEVDVNGTKIGQRAEYAGHREISGRVIGTAPIHSITVFKNDKKLKHWDYGNTQPNTLALSFYSDSYPYHPVDNPRGWRHWRGKLSVEGSQLTNITASNHDNRQTQHLAVDPNNPNLVDFATNTRGGYSTLFLEFDELHPTTIISIELEDADETGSGPPQLRRHQMIEGGKIELSVASITDGSFTRSMEVDGYNDAVILKRGSSMPMDVEFNLSDDQNPRHGDYYFVRVRQADDAMAWSSPIWIGGFATK